MSLSLCKGRQNVVNAKVSNGNIGESVGGKLPDYLEVQRQGLSSIVCAFHRRAKNRTMAPFTELMSLFA